MKCPNCQFDNPESNNFCGKCGVGLERGCPKCHFSNPADFVFCGKCGQALEGPEAAAPIHYAKPKAYTPKFLVEKILTTRSSIEGERKVVTVFFADVANYTSLAERLDPEEVHQIMDGCFKILMDEIHRYEGTINQFTGDGVMALFGAPIAHEDHAQRASYAALSVQRAMGNYGEKIRRAHGIDFKLRVGLNSGPVVVGSIGDDLRMDYTAGGDTTNLAARMESLANPGTILASGDLNRLAHDFFEFKHLGKLRVKGREEPVEVYELIKASEVETRLEAAMAKGLTKFVGREKELKVLTEAFEKARAGFGQVVGIMGEAGVGKSRLVLELRKTLPADSYSCLEGLCLPYGDAIAYLPILDMLRSYFDIKEREQESIIKKKMELKIRQLDPKLQHAFPCFHELLYLAVEDEAYLQLEPQEKRERTFEAIRDLIIRQSENKPLVLVVESVHWIDKTSEEFLTYFIDWLAKTRILLIVLYRPEYHHPWGGKSYYTQINLEQLSIETSTELVQSILGASGPMPRLGQLIFNRTDGNPLFIEELTRSLLENGIIQKRGSKYVLTRRDSDIQVPDTIQGIIAARIDSLDDHLKRTMQFAAVIGRDFSFRILEHVTDMPQELKSYLHQLQGLEFIYEKRLFPELEYTFKHALFQEVTYNGLLLKRRREIHEMVGATIEELYAYRLEEFYEVLAHHYARSLENKKAYQYLRLSGNKAARNHSLWEAFRYYKEALSALKSGPGTDENKPEEIAVLRLMTIPMRFLGYPNGSLQCLEAGEKLAREVGDKKSLAMFYSGMGHYFSIKGKGPLRGIRYTEKCFREAEKIQDIELLARAGLDLCVFYNMSGQFSQLIKIAQKVIGALEATKTELEYFGQGMNVYSVLHAYYGRSLGWLGNFEQANVLLQKGLSFASDIQDQRSAGWIEYVYGRLFAVKGDGENTIRHFQNAIGYTSEVNYILLLGLSWTGLGWGHYFLGQLDTAKTYIEKGLKIQSDAGISFHLSLHFLLLSIINFDSGDHKSALECIQKALRLSRQNYEKHFEGYSRMWFGRILGMKETSAENKGKEYILQGIKMAEGMKIRPHSAEGYLLLGGYYAERGQWEKALECLKRAEGMFQEMGMDYWLARTQAALKSLGNHAYRAVAP
jgi:class 3 adenylate cyclase/tetratricopeptide (TPR) repeat protein